MNDTLTVVTWNVMGPGDPAGQDGRVTAIIRTLRDLDADVILLQEAWDGLPTQVARSLRHGVAGEAPYGRGDVMCAVLTPEGSSRPGRSRRLELSGSEAGHPYAAVLATGPIGGTTWGFMSAHLPWGGRSEHARVSAASQIDRLAAADLPSPDQPVVLGADMNAGPAAASWRTLTGKQPAGDGEGMLWVDTWAVTNDGPGHTTGPRVAPLARTTAISCGSVRPDLEPSRRIDGVFSRGWCHGRRGGPVDAAVVRGPGVHRVSDHLPVVARLIR